MKSENFKLQMKNCRTRNKFRITPSGGFSMTPSAGLQNCFSPLLWRGRQKGRRGVTLAEVLIALTVIGIISAITVPAVIQSTQKQEFVTALQKSYSTLSQVTNQIIAEEGSPKCDDSGWACSLDGLYDIFEKHLNIMQKDSSKRKLYLSDGTVISLSNVFENCAYSDHINIDGSKDICAYLYADVNGQKKPNKIGRDNFLFVLKENGIYPAGCDKEGICMKDGLSYACTCKVLRERAVNY